MESYTCSFSYGHSAINHTLRDYDYTVKEKQKGRLKNVNLELTKNNIILKSCNSIEEEFNKTFAKYVNEYNQKQKRVERQIKNYFKKIKSLKKRSDGKSQMKTDYEYVVQFGDKDMSPKEATEMLKAVYYELSKLTNIHINYAAIHVDESTPHLHINITPLAFGYSKGMSVRPALDRACQQMFNLENRQFAYKKFLNWTKDVVMTQELSKRGYNREIKGEERAHSTVEEFKEKKKLEKEINELQDRSECLRQEIKALSTTPKEQVKETERRIEEVGYAISIEEKNQQKFTGRIERIRTRVNELRESLGAFIEELTNRLNWIADNKKPNWEPAPNFDFGRGSARLTQRNGAEIRRQAIDLANSQPVHKSTHKSGPMK